SCFRGTGADAKQHASFDRLSPSEDCVMPSVHPTRAIWPVGALAIVAALVAAPGCVDIVAGIDGGRYVERDEKQFEMTGQPDVVLSTFDGSIEIRPWDRGDVRVVVEKRGRDKEDIAAIEVKAEQTGNHVEVTVTEPRHTGFHINKRSAKLI